MYSIKKYGIITNVVLVIFIIMINFISQNIYAYNNSEWTLPNITIIPRSTWITDESIIYKTNTTQNITQHNDVDPENTIPLPQTKTQTINQYLTQVFSDQVILNGIITNINGKFFHRSRGYKTNKTHIIVHHTANNMSTVTTVEEAKTLLNSIFRYHTINNGRGDIGYNFIIDPWGNIYEGRGGGKDIVGAHAKYNNAPSIGIALMGNFEIHKPTEAQIDALTKLSTALMIEYKINPDSEIYAHIEDHEHPYIKDIITDTFIGHKDAGKTACPGKYLYDLLPQIQSNIKQNLIKEKKISTKKKVRQIIYQNETTYIQDKGIITVSLPNNTSILRCSTTTKNIKISCLQRNSYVDLTIQKKKETLPGSGPLTVSITTKGINRNIRFFTNIIRQSDQKQSLEDKKTKYINSKKPQLASTNSNKFIEQINLSDIRSYIQYDVSVLLYEASTTLSEWKFLCQNCTISDNNGTIYTDSTFSISQESGKLRYKSKTNDKIIDNISITPKDPNGASFITNYNRKSYAGIARNNFYGKIEIKKEPIQYIDTSNRSLEYVLINTLPFNLYLRGIVESNDTEPYEKIKTMALLSKNYILFYLNPSHRHPNIPSGASYKAIDDARSFQKYVGAGVDSTLVKWKQALEETKNEVITYNNNLAFLPYFSCSAGFTRSANEKYGRQDTPYLVSVYDPSPCTDFNGHGVGLAGNGATYMANNKSTYKDIITYFYPGTNISNY